MCYTKWLWNLCLSTDFGSWCSASILIMIFLEATIWVNDNFSWSALAFSATDLSSHHTVLCTEQPSVCPLIKGSNSTVYLSLILFQMLYLTCLFMIPVQLWHSQYTFHLLHRVVFYQACDLLIQILCWTSLPSSLLNSRLPYQTKQVSVTVIMHHECFLDVT